MKYYFTNNCYWDSEKLLVFRNDSPVDLPSSHTKILTTLLKNNGRFVSHEALYFAITGDENPYGDWKASLSNKFTRNKASEKGLLIRVPEINPFFEKSKSQTGGGYKISVPEESIVDTTAAHANLWDDYKDIWHSKKYWDNQQKKARASDQEWLSKKTKLYLQGEQCSWPLVFASAQYAPVKRDVVNELIEAIENEIGAIVLTGAGGEGKTTVLMQLCAELYNAGKNVLYHAPTHKYEIPDNVIDGIFLVDNPANTSEFKSFLIRATKEGLTVVIASRSNEWATLKETLFDDTRRSIKEIELPKISSSESKAFAQYLKTHIHRIKRSVVELEKLFFKDSYGFLYASMLMAIYNADSLEKIAEEIIERISKFENGETTLRILAAIVFAEQAGTAIGTRTYRALCKHFSVDDRDVKYYLRKEVVLNGTVYQTRHESISQLFYKYLFEDGDWWTYLNEEEREDVIIAVLDIYFCETAKVTRDYKPTDPRAIEIANLVLQGLMTINYEETLLFINQRLFESCQQHGHAIIDRVYHHANDDVVKSDLAAKCFEHKLPVWEIYNHWTRNLLNASEHDESTFDLLRVLCVDMGAPVNLWITWVNAQKKCATTSESDMVREIYLLGTEHLTGNSSWWGHWASFEAQNGNIGSINDMYTARWVFDQGCEQNGCDPHLWLKWARFERNLGNNGDFEKKYTARWIFKEGCSRDAHNPHLWLEWIDLECQIGNYGDINSLYTARWIAKEGCARTASTHLWIKRAEIEIATKNIGDIACEGSARWILYTGANKYPKASNIWIKWAELEEIVGNVGDYETENSAAWIYQTACTQNGIVSDAAIWLKWVDFATNNNSTMHCARVDDFTPSKILKIACIDHNIPNSQVWMKWATTEEVLGNIGNYSISYSAAWIHKEACMRNVDDDEQIWVAWAYFIERNKEHSNLLSDYPPDVVLRNKCLSGTKDVSPWIAWAVVEEAKDNIGDYSTEYSAAWLYQESCVNQNSTENSTCWLKWARFAHKNPLHNEHGELINAEYVLEYAQRTCPAFNNQLWIDLANFKKEIGYQ